MDYFWRLAYAAAVFAGFVLEFAAACKVDAGTTIMSVMPMILSGLALMVVLKPMAAYEEWCEGREEN